MEKIKDKEERLWDINKIVENGWRKNWKSKNLLFYLFTGQDVSKKGESDFNIIQRRCKKC
ncbi:hypothetical protein [Clostridium sp.]|uniref:hypothetical protein n=1 Tax=Clostridium sp. TaxID=1506 RepID=UPI0039E9209E